MARLSRLPNIIGVKDASNDITRPLVTRQLCGPEFCQLSGEDGNALAFLAHGGHGCISVTANVAPALCAAMQDAWAAGHPTDALALQDQLYPLHTALFLETSPAPSKYALSRLGKCSAELRLPLVEIGETTAHAVDAALASAGLLGTV